MGGPSVMQAVALDRRCAGAVAQSADNFTHHIDIGTVNSAFPNGKPLLVVTAAVATAPLERHDRTGTSGQVPSLVALTWPSFESPLHSETCRPAKLESCAIDGFVEPAGRSLTKSAYGGNVVTLDLGAAYYIDIGTQIDAAVHLGANDNTPDHACTIGLSHCFH
ncbi:Uncharacterized protein ToN1_04470 [Aromatoleum petrolei]|nr:Uncharacterized protein ToN1_04470 [Aromatoleum petrolei]